MSARERFIGVEEARSQIGSLVLSIAEGARPLVLTRRGKPLAVLVSLRDYERIKVRRAT